MLALNLMYSMSTNKLGIHYMLISKIKLTSQFEKKAYAFFLMSILISYIFFFHASSHHLSSLYGYTNLFSLKGEVLSRPCGWQGELVCSVVCLYVEVRCIIFLHIVYGWQVINSSQLHDINSNMHLCSLEDSTSPMWPQHLKI